MNTATKARWLGSVSECDTCHRPIAQYFVDGRTITGSWAIMCPTCFPFYGIGLGTGRGQEYKLDHSTGHYYKTAG